MSRTLGDVISDVAASDEHHLYSSLAPVYDFVYDRHFDYEGQLAVVREAVPRDATSVLEGGCGTGQLLALLEAQYDHVVGVDVNDAMVAIARDRLSTASVVTADVETVCFETAFDAVVMLGRVFPHALTDEAATGLLENCYSCLAPGGVVVFNTFDRRGLEDGQVTEDEFTSEDYQVARTLTGFANDLGAGRWGFDAEYTITDRRTGQTAVAQETMHLRAHLPADLESYLAAAGFSEVSFVEESDFSLRAVARKPTE